MGNITLTGLLEAGAHFGHQARRWNPAMSKYIYDQRGGVHIFDLAKTKAGIEEAAEFIRGVINKGGKVLFVGTKRQAAEFVKDAAVKAGMPYVTLRWLGGTLTNFGQIQKRVTRMKTLKEQREKGELKRYTKYEQLQFDREIAKLERFLGGIADLDKLPDAMFVVDTHREAVAVAEANRVGVPVVGIVDSNSDPRLVSYVIPSNDDAVKALEMIIAAVGDAAKPRPVQPAVTKQPKAGKAGKKTEEVGPDGRVVETNYED